jgi:hypothetical protein
MPERFEITGRVTALEQKRYREGGGLIPGFWSVKLQTPEGERTCSFNSDRRKSPSDPNGAREPHPDFALIQRAQTTGETIRIRGHLTTKGDRTFKNGTSAELVGSEAEQAASPPSVPAAPTASRSEVEDAKWAVETILPRVDVDPPMGERDQAHIKEEAHKLLAATEDVAEDLVTGDDERTEGTSELERRRGEKRRRKGIA